MNERRHEDPEGKMNDYHEKKTPAEQSKHIELTPEECGSADGKKKRKEKNWLGVSMQKN